MIAWKLNTSNLNVASARYRALLPIQALEKIGFDSSVVWGDAVVDFNTVEAIIFVKSFSLNDLRLARDAHANAVPIIIDLCDNIFIEGYGKGKSGFLLSDVFKEMARLSTAIVTTGEALKRVICTECSSVNVVVIPDSVETDLDSHAATRKVILSIVKNCLGVVTRTILQPMSIFRTVGGYFKRTLRNARKFCKHSVRPVLKKVIRKKYAKEQIRRLWVKGVRPFLRLLHPYGMLKLVYKIFSALRSKIREIFFARVVDSEAVVSAQKPRNKPKRLLWFGNHGAPHAQFGMLDILLLKDALVDLSAVIDIELVVISNNKQKYIDNIAPLAFRSRYLAWNPNTIHSEIRCSDIVLIPNSRDAFSLCKSANRSVLSLQLGVPVVATKTPALDLLSECIYQDDWQLGITSYLQSPSLVKEHVEKAQKLIRENYSAVVIGKLWSGLLKDVAASKMDQNSASPFSRKDSIAFCIGSKLDLDLLVPIIEAVQRNSDLRCYLVVAQSVLEESLETRELILSFPDDYSILSLTNIKELSVRMAQSVGALISGVETNLNPHRLVHEFVKRLNDKDVNTYTLQHGLDNVGLTYNDKIQPIGKIKFASDVIFTWLPPLALHSGVRDEVREKCVHAGCTKLVPKDRVLPVEVRRIGVFENIHWHRYSEQYRVDFLANLNLVAKAFPLVEFIVKPHPSGLWLTDRYTGELPDADNITILSSGADGREWTKSCSSLLQYVDAVITTPSTVALDAASMGLPVAVVSADLEIPSYEPLYLLPNAESWLKYVDEVGSVGTKAQIQENSSVFSERYRSSGDAVNNILTRVCVDLNQPLAG